MAALQAFTSPARFATLTVVIAIDWHIGDVIVKLRKRARMNQTVLAARVGVNKATIVRAEDGDGKVSRETYLKIAYVLKTDIAALEAEAARLQAEQQDAIRQSGVSESDPLTRVRLESSGKRGGGTLAVVSGHPENDPVSHASHPEIRRTATDLLRHSRAPQSASEPAPVKRAAGGYVAAPRPPAARHGAAHRKHRR